MLKEKDKQLVREMNYMITIGDTDGESVYVTHCKGESELATLLLSYDKDNYVILNIVTVGKNVLDKEEFIKREKSLELGGKNAVE